MGGGRDRREVQRRQTGKEWRKEEEEEEKKVSKREIGAIGREYVGEKKWQGKGGC